MDVLTSLTLLLKDRVESNVTPRIFRLSAMAAEQPKTKKENDSHDVLSPGLVPKTTASDLSRLSSKSLPQNQLFKATVHLHSLLRISPLSDWRIVYNCVSSV